MARRSPERVLDEHQLDGIGGLGKPVRRTWAPRPALVPAAAAAYTATLFATHPRSGGAIYLSLHRVPKRLKFGGAVNAPPWLDRGWLRICVATAIPVPVNGRQ